MWASLSASVLELNRLDDEPSTTTADCISASAWNPHLLDKRIESSLDHSDVSIVRLVALAFLFIPLRKSLIRQTHPNGLPQCSEFANLPLSEGLKIGVAYVGTPHTKTHTVYLLLLE